MNKIYIDTSNYELIIDKNVTYYLVNNFNNLVLKIKVLKNIKATIYLETIKNSILIQVEMDNNTSLLVNSLGINASISSEINLSENSSIRFVSSIASNIDTINNIKIKHKGQNSKSIYLANGVNLASCKFYFTIDGIIQKESRGSFLEESSTIINVQDGDSKIIPNMIIDNEDIMANHAAYIGRLKEEDIYYLESRGLTLKEIEKILLKANLLKGMEEEVKEIFTSIINQEIKF